MQEGADSSVIHAFVPVYANHERVMVIGISMEWKDIITKVLQVSLIVLGVMAELFLILGAIFLTLLKKIVLKPLKAEQAAINAYKADKDSQKAASMLRQISTNNEMEELADDFASMIEEIEQYVTEVRSVTAEKERIGAELDMAKEIQAGQLPSVFPAFPERTEFDIHATMKTAKEVGGDFYDFFFVDHDHLGIVMADVSGKGVPAALFMMVSKMIINNFAMMGLEPHEVLEKANDTICKNNKQQMFVTVWLGILEISTGKIVAANAGHEYPIIRQPDGRFELFKDKHGFVIGGIKNKKYKQYEFTLQKGGTLVCLFSV